MNIEELNELKNDVLTRRRNANTNDIHIIKDLNREYSRIQMKIKYYSDEDYRKAKCETVKAYNKTNIIIYNNYQKIYQRNKKLKNDIKK